MDSPLVYPPTNTESTQSRSLAHAAVRYALLRICIKQLLSAIEDAPYRSGALMKAVELAKRTLEETE